MLFDSLTVGHLAKSVKILRDISPFLAWCLYSGNVSIDTQEILTFGKSLVIVFFMRNALHYLWYTNTHGWL